MSLLTIISFLLTLGYVSADGKRCRDLYKRSCRVWARLGYCDKDTYKATMQRNCRKTCDLCNEPSCVDLAPVKLCEAWAMGGLCGEGGVGLLCQSTCQQCKQTATYCPSLTIKHGYFLKDGVDVDESKVPKKDVHPISKPGEVVRIQCKEGFEILGKNEVTCLDSGVYNGSLGVCIHKDECKVPSYDVSYDILDRYYLVGADTDANNYVPPGTFIAMVCLKNNRKLEARCTSHGQWNPPLLDCNDDSRFWSRWYPEKDELNETKKKRHLNKRGLSME